MADLITPDTLRFERTLDAPVERVWQFLIDPDLRARWFMGGPTDAKVGGRITMTMNHDALSDDDVPTPERYQPFLGNSWEERITQLQPPTLLGLTWEEGKAGEVTFELSPLGDNRTKLVLTHSGLCAEAARNTGSGWHAHLAALERRIAGKGVANFWALHAEAEAEIARALG